LILVDTSGLLAATFPDQKKHPECFAILRSTYPRILSPFVLAELDYLAHKEGGVEAELMILEDVRRGAYELATFGVEDVAEALSTIDKYRDLNVGLADASIVVLANRRHCTDVLTLDERHFRALRTRRGPFRILPADA
jgi:predicted nucleic acid-binding protein